MGVCDDDHHEGTAVRQFFSRRLDIAEQWTFGSITAYRQPTPILEVASPMRKTKDYWSSVTPNGRDGREEPAISTIWR